MASQHSRPAHDCERMSLAEAKNVRDLENYVSKAKEKITECQEEFPLVDQYLSDLQEQLESSRGQIEETYQSYRSLLEKRRVYFKFETCLDIFI